MKSIKLLLTLFVLINCISISYSQSGKITGSLKDGGNQKIIDAATVSLLRSKDSTLIKSSLADQNGNFVFENLKDNTYLVRATSIGHTVIYSKPVNILNSSAVSVGTLQLITQTKVLKEVAINTNKPFIERKIDKTIVNVDALISNAGSTVMDVLEKSPGVSVDKDGNISLKGKQAVTIMLDGKPAYLSGEQLANLLKNMPSSNIDQIEIMTNPSAKYDASGNSGIINIKTKKNKLKGFNGNLSTSYIQGVYWKNNNSLNLNYRNGKFNLFGNYSYSHWSGFEDLKIVRNFRNTTTKALETIFEQYSYMRHTSDEHNIKTGIDFYLNKKTTIGIVLSGIINPDNHSGDNNTYLKDGNGTIDSIVYATNSQKNKSTNFGTNLNFRHQFDSLGTEVTADADYITYNQKQNQYFVNNFLNPDRTVRSPFTELRGDLPSQVKIYSAKLDFTKPLKKNAKIEAGLKSSYVTTDNDAGYENNTAAGWVTDATITNHFIYDENINAAYINANKQIKKWGIQAGLRLENTVAQGHQLGNSLSPDSSFKRNYTNLFPTLYVSYDMNKTNTFSVNYGRRIDRPDYQDLNPFYYFLDKYTYQVGNTLLKPQFTNSIELSHTYKGFLTTTLNYSKTKDVFADVLDQINSERKTFVRKDNIATKTNAGIAVSAYFPVTKFWTTNIYGNVVNDTYKGALNGGVLNVNSTLFMTNINNQFKFKKGWSAEMSGFYRSKGIEGQIVVHPMWQVSSGVQKQVLKDKGTVKLSFSDIFKSQTFIGTVKYQDIDIYIRSNNDRRRASLTFTYRFGKPMKNQDQHRKAGGAGDEQSRVKSGNN
ncbi:MAG: TonB-dependent receptor [Chitinophagaceae bacterium]|nr:TonB-dependent receptor [Chitinophagaceae bacterium]